MARASCSYSSTSRAGEIGAHSTLRKAYLVSAL